MKSSSNSGEDNTNNLATMTTPVVLEKVAKEKVVEQKSVDEVVQTQTTAADDNNNSPDDSGADTTKKNKNKGGGVSFGTAHVNEFRMTMGSNPSASSGVAVELSWDKVGSQLFDISSKTEQEEERKKPVYRVPLVNRLKIAQANHSRNSIVARTNELEDIQKSRKQSSKDDDDDKKKKASDVTKSKAIIDQGRKKSSPPKRTFGRMVFKRLNAEKK